VTIIVVAFLYKYGDLNRRYLLRT